MRACISVAERCCLLQSAHRACCSASSLCPLAAASSQSLGSSAHVTLPIVGACPCVCPHLHAGLTCLPGGKCAAGGTCPWWLSVATSGVAAIWLRAALARAWLSQVSCIWCVVAAAQGGVDIHCAAGPDLRCLLFVRFLFCLTLIPQPAERGMSQTLAWHRR